MSWIGQPLPPGWTVEWARLPREDRAGWHHIGGQDVELTLYHRRGYRSVFRTQFLTFRCAFELCGLY